MQDTPARIPTTTGGKNSKDPTLQMSVRDGMQETTYTDEQGRNYVVFVKPNMAPSKGIIKGPQPLDSLGLDMDTNVRLHNELYNRGIITHHDAMRKPEEVRAAIQQALRVNVQRVQNAYLGIAQPANQPKQQQPDTPQLTPQESNKVLQEGTMTKQEARDMAKEDVEDAR